MGGEGRGIEKKLMLKDNNVMIIEGEKGIEGINGDGRRIAEVNTQCIVHLKHTILLIIVISINSINREIKYLETNENTT